MTRGRTTSGLRGLCAAIMVWRATWLGATALAGMVTPALAAAQEAEAHDFVIPAGPLDDALTAFAQQSGLEVGATTDDIRAAASPGVSGQLTAEAALARLLAGTGFTGRLRGGRVTIERLTAPTAADTITTDALRVEGQQTAETGSARDARGYDDIYDRDTTTTYMGKDEVERYKGVTSADVLKGMLGVYSGDARNGGGIDPSIRGISGPGRVPVIVDGTEQALTVWRGYNGASNRAYIDPNLIAGIQVAKGPVSERGVDGSSGGAVVVRTLDATDILRKGQAFGIEAKLEGGDNSTEPRLPRLSLGQSYRDLPLFPGNGITDGLVNYPGGDPAVRVKARSPNDNHLISFGDKAARIAVAGRLGAIDLLGAYAYRTRGNYFAGEHDAGYYSQVDADPKKQGTFIQRMAFNYRPGYEVTNTSSRTSSWLAKAVWHLDDTSYLKAGFRDTRSTYGDILPSRVVGYGSPGIGSLQWTLGHIHSQAYNLDYKLQPNLWWLDFKASFWDTHTLSDTNSNGGYPQAASYSDPILRDTAILHQRNDRFGAIASNQFKFGSRFDLLLQGNWQREVLRPIGESAVARGATWCGFFCGNNRSGRRGEYRIDLKAEWRPASFLKLDAGLTYAGFHAIDDKLREAIEAGDRLRVRGVAGYANMVGSFNIQSRDDYRRAQYGDLIHRQYSIDDANRLADTYTANYDDRRSNGWNNKYTYLDPFYPDRRGKITRSQVGCLNGSYTDRSRYGSEFGATGTGLQKNCSLATVFSSRTLTMADTQLAGHNLAPTVSASFYINNSVRTYIRYAEYYRYPSIFESTSGFSQSLNADYKLRPEHLHSLEAAYIQDLRPLLRLHDDQKADFRLTWYRNVTTDVIDRNTNLQSANLDKQILSGIEAQTRYDNGRLFFDIGYAHVIVNHVCDETRALTTDTINIWLDRIPTCVKYGFYGGYLLTQAAPDDSLNASFGARLFDRRLELGPRIVWYSQYKNDLLDTLLNSPITVDGYALNVPYSWGRNLTVDAYVRFHVDDRFTAELNGTNLTDHYYSDPLSRTLNPAPGRTLRLSLTGRL
jgi:hemoglobin/transferrin/lactoferrin receptor protein